MDIALLDVDSKIPNLALMKISAYHKQQGDTVRLYNPIEPKPDKLYVSKVFKFSNDYQYLPDCEIVYGGTGYDLQNKLPQNIEHIYPDYSLYGCDYAIGFTTRGCIRKCKFCIVPEKEGGPEEVADIYEFWNGQKNLMLLDNNLTALPDKFEKTCIQIINNNIKVDISQGLDIRLIDDHKAKLLSKVKLWKQIHFAFDDVKLESVVTKGIETLAKYMSKSRLMFYILIGFNSTHKEDLYRVELLRKYGVDSFVMPYNKHDPYQAKFARFVNRKAIFKSCEWKDYKR